jgi:hypothetical protein
MIDPCLTHPSLMPLWRTGGPGHMRAAFTLV